MPRRLTLLGGLGTATLMVFLLLPLGAGAQEVVRCGPALVTTVGTPGNDVIVGTDGNDIIAGLGGNDTIYGDQGADDLGGDSGTDACHGGSGVNDTATTCETTSGVP